MNKHGKRVKTAKKLLQILKKRGSVYHLWWKRPTPVAWLFNLPFGIVQRWLDEEVLYEYSPEKK